MNSESEFPRTSTRLWVRTASVHTQASNRRGRLPKGSLLSGSRRIIPSVYGPLTRLVLKPVAGVGAGQGAQRHHPRHEAQIGVRFAGLDKLVHLIGLGEVVQRLGRGFADCSFTGPSRPAMTSPMGTSPSRLRAMPYSPMFPGQKGGAFSAAESTKVHLQMGSILPCRVAVVESRRKGGGGDRRRANYWLLLAEGYLNRRLFGDMLRRIWALPVPGG